MRPPSHIPLAEMITAPARIELMRMDSSTLSVKRTLSRSGSFEYLSVIRVAASAIGEST
ncbi:hypothetical protein D3C83_25640 [compost metagenome]